MLDIPTLFVISTCVMAVLGLFLLFAWIQDRSIRALAWWSAAYLVGSLAAALWSMQDALSRALTVEIVYALLFAACGIIWTGARLFHSRPALPGGMLGGAILWLIACQIPVLHQSDTWRIMLGSLVIASYTALTACELWRERGDHLFSRWPAIVVLGAHGIAFSLPIPLVLLLPADSGLVLSSGWFSIMVLETLLFAIGTAFIILVMAKERSDLVHRAAASTDELTGIANRRGFMEEAERLIRKQAWKNQPVTVLMFDLDHFKKINDRFGHAVGDEALRVFARTATVSLRASDVIGRLGGEEFAAVLTSDLSVALVAAERVRAAFAAAAAEVVGESVAATVSIGIAAPTEMPCDLAAVLARADAALYRAKKAGRNRVEADTGEEIVEGAPVAADGDRRRDDVARPKDWAPAAPQVTSGPAPVALRVVDGKWLRAAS